MMKLSFFFFLDYMCVLILRFQHVHDPYPPTPYKSNAIYQSKFSLYTPRCPTTNSIQFFQILNRLQILLPRHPTLQSPIPLNLQSLHRSPPALFPTRVPRVVPGFTHERLETLVFCPALFGTDVGELGCAETTTGGGVRVGEGYADAVGADGPV